MMNKNTSQPDKSGAPTVLVADDHTLISDMMSKLLTASGSFQVKTAVDMEQTKRVLSQSHCDIIMLDYRMPGMTGIGAIKDLRNLFPELKIVIFSGNITEEVVSEAFDLGAVGYVPKTMPADTIPSVLHLILAGQKFLPASFQQYQANRSTVAKSLSTIEAEILQNIAEGATNKEIARNFTITEMTVKMHLRSIFKKLNVSNRTQAALAAHNYSMQSK